jgi:hypothetical protein
LRRDGWENTASKATGEARAEESSWGLAGRFGSVEDDSASIDVATPATVGSTAGSLEEGRVPSGHRRRRRVVRSRTKWGLRARLSLREAIGAPPTPGRAERPLACRH